MSMRRDLCIFLIFVILGVVVLVAGCNQQAPPAATPVPTLPPVETAEETPAPTVSVPVEKSIDFNVKEDGSDLIVRYLGGPDSADLIALKISIENYSLLSRSEREDNPVINQEYVFPQMATANPDLVTIVGVFRDGTEQILFKKKL